MPLTKLINIFSSAVRCFITSLLLISVLSGCIGSEDRGPGQIGVLTQQLEQRSTTVAGQTSSELLGDDPAGTTEESRSYSLPSPTAVPISPIIPRFAFFYRPPYEEADLSLLLELYDFYILTYGDEVERDILRQGMGETQRTILQYLRFDTIQDPGSCTDRPRRNQAAFQPGDFCQIASEHPDWFLLDTRGKRLSRESDDAIYYMMDAGNPGWREFFTRRLLEMQAEPGWDGVFLDNVELTMKRLEDRDWLPDRYVSDTQYQEAVRGFLAYLCQNYADPQQKLLYANMIARREEEEWSLYLPYVDGMMHEGFAAAGKGKYREPDIWERQLSVVEAAQQQGRTVLLIPQADGGDMKQQQFVYASYLLANHGLAVFRYANSDSYREIWWYDNFNIDLGQPLGPRYQDGKAWKRDFENGVVWVNPKTHDAGIEIK